MTDATVLMVLDAKEKNDLAAVPAMKKCKIELKEFNHKPQASTHLLLPRWLAMHQPMLYSLRNNYQLADVQSCLPYQTHHGGAPAVSFVDSCFVDWTRDNHFGHHRHNRNNHLLLYCCCYSVEKVASGFEEILVEIVQLDYHGVVVDDASFLVAWTAGSDIYLIN